jgi:hypothetical protein
VEEVEVDHLPKENARLPPHVMVEAQKSSCFPAVVVVVADQCHDVQIPILLMPLPASHHATDEIQVSKPKRTP